MTEGGAIDNISAAIGRIDAYIHEYRHTANNLSMKFDGLDVQFSRKLEAAESRISTNIDKLRSEHSQELVRINAATALEIEGVKTRLMLLETDRAQRTGAISALATIPRILAFVIAIASVFSALWLAGRSVGVIPAPPVPAARLEATTDPEGQRIEGTVGGKP